MNSLALLLAAAAVGVDYGWQPTGDGSLEYIIQIEPVLLQTLIDGEDIVSEIHPDVKGVRRFRIRVGTEQLPRKGASDEPKNPPAVNKPSVEPPGGSFLDSPVKPPPLDKKPGGTNPSLPNFDIPPLDGETTLPPASNDNAHFRDDRTLPPIPNPITVDPNSEPIASQVNYNKERSPKAEEVASKPKRTPGKPKTPTAASKPWLPLVLTVLLLFASVGLNAYLGWIAWGFYQRMQSMASDLSKSPAGIG